MHFIFPMKQEERRTAQMRLEMSMLHAEHSARMSEQHDALTRQLETAQLEAAEARARLAEAQLQYETQRSALEGEMTAVREAAAQDQLRLEAEHTQSMRQTLLKMAEEEEAARARLASAVTECELRLTATHERRLEAVKAEHQRERAELLAKFVADLQAEAARHEAESLKQSQAAEEQRRRAVTLMDEQKEESQAAMLAAADVMRREMEEAMHAQVRPSHFCHQSRCNVRSALLSE